MEAAFEDASVTAFTYLVPAMSNHPKDRHVLAAAVRSGARVIVTFNGKDFPAESVDPYGVEVVSPDEFLEGHYALAPALLRQKIADQARSLGVPVDALLDKLHLSAPRTVFLLR